MPVVYYFNLDILIPRLGGRAAVYLYLEADGAVLFDRVVRLSVIDGLVSVDPELDAASHASDNVFVPVVRL